MSLGCTLGSVEGLPCAHEGGLLLQELLWTRNAGENGEIDDGGVETDAGGLVWVHLFRLILWL